ncbi:MAG: substrate-binding domain-containing protein, partial [Chloroflexi bacterium]|nr:substrate-binding domain-containing protein [Chloroflexota bacterium]
MMRGLIGYRRAILLGALGLMLVLGACEQAAVNPPQPTTITIAGATAMQPVLHDLTAEFSRQHPNVLFNWLGSSSVAGEEQLRAGQVDLAASTLLPPTAMTTTATPSAPASLDAGASRIKSSAFVYIPIGLDGLALIVDPANKIENLTLVQLRDLFSGQIIDWSMLGGEPSAVQLVSREDGSGSRYLFESQVMGLEPVALTAVVMPSSADVVDYVAQNPGAIGYVSRAYVIDALAAQSADPSATATPIATNLTGQKQVRIVRLENQLPSVENIKNQSYFLTQPLYLISSGQPRG